MTPKPTTEDHTMLANVAPAPVPARHLYRIPEAMRLLSISRSVLYEQLRTGRLRSVSQGRTRLIPARAIHDYVTLLEREAQGTTYDQTA